MAHSPKAIPRNFGWRNLNNLLLPAADYVYFQNSQDFPFQANATQHSAINAWWLAECALLSYQTEQVIKSNVLTAFKPWSPTFRAFKGNQKGLSGFGIQCDDFAILSFRGTEFYQPQAILADLIKLRLDKVTSVSRDIFQDTKLWTRKIQTSPQVEVSVVQGFYEPLQEIWPELKFWIDTLPPGKNVWLTGHSLGGALAGLVTFLVPNRVAGVYTFGCPCIGEQDFATAFDNLAPSSQTFRYLHGNDAIAKGLEFPGSWYRHVGQLKFIDSAAHKSWWQRWTNALFPIDITDHAPLYYALHCWNLLAD